jgi:hypothetical protein
MGKRILKKILGPGWRELAIMMPLGSSLAGGCQKDLGEYLQSGKVLAVHGLQGRWTGPAVPEASSCGPTTRALMTVGEEGFGLDPFQSTTVIHGKISDDSHLVGNLVRQAPEHREVSISFDGIARGSDAISGKLQSGRCHWTVELHRG